uniref:Galanin domain-containing protein n=1 Tax=Hucho hucho TaxID=62062 RepID=A0A4W5N9M3_9TELE
MQMQRRNTILCAFLVLFGQLSESSGMALMGSEKRGWTLNSAGYLLGPYAQRTLTVRHRPLLGKRSVWEEDVEPFQNSEYKSVIDDAYVQAFLDFITYLRLKEIGATEDLSTHYLVETKPQ